MTTTLRHRLLAGLGLTLVLVVALARPNAAKPDLGSGGPLDGLLPLSLGAGAVTALLWTAYAVAALALVVGLRGVVRPLRWVSIVAIGLLALVAAPIGSADHLNYAAYGRILVGGGDPWLEPPAAWGGGLDPIASAVEEPWREEPSVYGPVATALHALAAWLGGSDLRLVVLAWQVVVVLAWLGIRWAVRALVDPRHHGRVDVVWTLNPLVVAHGLLGAHVDTVATLLAVLALVVLRRLPGPWGAPAVGALVALAASTKVTYGVVGPAVVLAWVLPGAGAGGAASPWWPGCTRRIGLLLTGFLPVLALAHGWAGPHVYDQLARARDSVSFASPWRVVLVRLRPELGNELTRSLITVGAALLALALAVMLARATAPAGPAPPDPAGRAAWLTAVLCAAYSLAAPYTLPWYDLLAWATLPVVALGLLDGVLLARLVTVSAAYVPGRVLGLTPDVEALTMWVRRGVAPWLQLALWGVTLVLALVISRGGARAGSVPSPVPRRRGR